MSVNPLTNIGFHLHEILIKQLYFSLL